MTSKQLKTAFLICCLTITASGVFADTDHAMAELKKGNHTEAFKELKPLAEQGDARAQMNLGQLYDYGKGITQNTELAAKWYLKAANQGHLNAQINTAMLYYNGEGVPKDLKKAKEWYQKAANQGSAEAQLGLSGILLLEEENETSTKEAAEWALKAANQGLTSAQETMGKLYVLGIGVPKDIIKGNYWLTKAATQSTDTPPLIYSQPPSDAAEVKQNAKPITTSELKLTKLTAKAKELWDELNTFRYNPTFHKYAFMQGTSLGGKWRLRQNALQEDCVSFRNTHPTEISGLFELCLSISDMWLVGADWANNQGNNTPETESMILQIEKTLSDKARTSH